MRVNKVMAFCVGLCLFALSYVLVAATSTAAVVGAGALLMLAVFVVRQLPFAKRPPT